MFDLGPAAQEMTRVVENVADDQLERATPCADWTVADLLAHIDQFAVVFAANALKEPVEPPDGLVEDWRAAITWHLDEMARAWRDPSAWQGRVSAGGVEMDAPDNAVVAMEELTVHAWDLATGQQLRTTDAALDQIDRFFELFGDGAAEGEGPFGSVAPEPADATRLERTLARTGRDPRARA